MKSHGLQDLIKTLFFNPLIRSQFENNPRLIIDRFIVDKVERNVLLNPDVQKALVSGDVNILRDQMDVWEMWI